MDSWTAECPHCNGTGEFRPSAGERLKLLRKRSSATQDEVSSALGVSRSQLANIEAGRSGLTADVLTKACKFFQVSADWLLGLKHGEPETPSND